MRISIFILSIIIFWSCQEEKVIIPIPDTSSIKIETDLTRYEQELVNIDLTDLEASFSKLQNRYPAFTDLYFTDIVPINENNYDSAFFDALKELLSDNRFIKLADTVNVLYPAFESTIWTDLQVAFKNYKYYFPSFQAPQVYTLISEYAFQKFLFEEDSNREGLGIGLDLFLGNRFPYEKIAPGHPSFSDYLTRTFTKEHIVSKSIKTILDDRWPAIPKRNMLDFMIDNGKKLYVLNHILPETPDSIIIEYSSAQMEWADQNDIQIWAFLFGEKLFYESDMLKINKYINISPNAPGMPDEAPGRIGNYIGWQIIKSYMERFPETTMQELLEVTNAQKILEQSKYKPKRKK